MIGAMVAACFGLLAICALVDLPPRIRDARAAWDLRHQPQPWCPHCTTPVIDCVPGCDHYWHTCDELHCPLTGWLDLELEELLTEGGTE